MAGAENTSIGRRSFRRGEKRNLYYALAGAVLGFLVRRGNRRVPGWRRRRSRADLALLQGFAGLFSASGLRAAGDDTRSRRRRRAARRIFQGAASLPADPGGAETRHQR